MIAIQTKVSLRCFVYPSSSSAPFAMTRPMPRSPHIAFLSVRDTSAVPHRADTPGSHLGGRSCARSKTSCVRKWTPSEHKKSTSLPSCLATSTKQPADGPNTATTCSASSTEKAPITSWDQHTKRCSHFSSRTCTPATKTCLCRCTKFKRSIATKRVHALACYVVASSS